jgi:hypothetical protein
MVAFLFRSALLCSILGLVAGCSDSDPFAGDPEADYERLCAESCDRLAEVTGHLSTIEDEASLEAALPKIRSSMDHVVSAIEQQNEIIARGYRPNEANANKWKARLSETMEAAKPDFDRIADIPGVEKIKAELLRATKVPKPQVRSQTASRGGVARISKQMQDDFKALALVYHHHHDAHRQGPPSWEEAIAFCRKSGDSRGIEVLERLRQKGVVVYWGIRLRDVKVGTSNYVVAYEKKTPMEGGLALHLDGHTEALTPGQLLTFLAHQADVDLKIFGKTPPVPVQFASGTTPEAVGVPGFTSMPWPPDDPIINVRAPASQPSPKPVKDNRASQTTNNDRPSTGGSLPPKLGRGSPSSMPEPDHEPTPRPDDSTESRPGMSNPFGRGGNPRGPFRPESPGLLDTCQGPPSAARLSQADQPTRAPEQRTAFHQDNERQCPSDQDPDSEVPEHRTRLSTARLWEAKAARRGEGSIARDAP